MKAPLRLFAATATAALCACASDKLEDGSDLTDTGAAACRTDANCQADQRCEAGACVPRDGADTEPADAANDASLDAVDSGDAVPSDTGGADADDDADSGPVDTTPVDTTPVDTTPVDTTPVDTTPVDTTPADTGSDVVELPWAIDLTTPVEGSLFPVGDPITYAGALTGTGGDWTAYDVLISSSVGGLLFEGHPAADGSFTFGPGVLDPGMHTIRARAVAPDGNFQVDTALINICPGTPLADFSADLDPAVWLVRGDATRDPGGWLELTGSSRSRAGAIYNLVDTLSAGDVEIRLRISTGECATVGPCSPTQEGADGFAMSIWNVASVDELNTILATASNGGGLGYGVSGLYGSMAVEAFHVEFDTYFNNGDQHVDPTRTDHIAITFNGDPGNHILYHEIPNMEDNAWHDVVLNVVGSHVSVSWDGEVVIDSDVDGLRFKGGYIGFTGSTGWFYNHHRIDDLVIRQSCATLP